MTDSKPRNYMLHLKSYVGSIVLAALLLQGCGSSSDSETTTDTAAATAAVETFDATTSFLSSSALSDEEKAQVTSDLTLKMAALDASNEQMKTFVDSLIAKQETITNRKEAYEAIAKAMTSNTTDAAAAPELHTASILSTITDPVTDLVTDGIVDLLDTSVGNEITAATFDVVLNSEGVTVVMIDAARASETMAEIMVDALEADWSLTDKMCPMLQENVEFGEKFTALAEESDLVGRFFFERIDAPMYACLADAMILSNDDEDAVNNRDYGDYAVKYSTNGYMALLMDRYATDYFIAPTGSTEVRRADKFVSLLLDTGLAADYNATSKTFENHGDGNELTNEKFFYALFKTPNTTAQFISAMEKIDEDVKVMLMDNIFLGTQENGTSDTMQGYLNIIAIGSSMYDGIYGTKDENGVRQNAFGFGAYTADFINFALLIPMDRYVSYGKAFVNAGYQYAAFHGIDVWAGVSDTVKAAWNAYTSDTTADTNTTTATNAPARSAGLGITESDWTGDIKDLFVSAWGRVDYIDLYDAFKDENSSVWTELSDQANAAYHTVIDGRDDNGTLVKEWSTEIHNDLNVFDDEVYGFHGLIELATQEDIYYATCGNRSTNYIGVTEVCENNESYTMENAKAAFTLPPFADLTWSYVYGTAKDGATAYVSDNINADWFADLSDNDLVRQYFYPSADNVYIPNWMLSINWLSLPTNVTDAKVEAKDFSFNSGYFDIYVTSTNPALLTDIVDANGTVIDSAEIDLSELRDVNVTRVEMGSDTVIAVDENGTTLDGLYVYQVRVISPEDTAAVLNKITDWKSTVEAWKDALLVAIGLDSSSAANVDTTDANTTTTDTNTTVTDTNTTN